MTPPLLPTTRLFACPSCQQHVKSSEAVCPHCGARLGTSDGGIARAAAAVLMGLSLASCTGGDPEPEYGVPTTMSASDSDTEGTTEGTTAGRDTEGTTAGSDTEGTTGDTTLATTTVGSTTEPEPDYGVPTTDETTDTTDTTTDTTTMDPEPEYGVPTTDPEPDYGVPDTGE